MTPKKFKDKIYCFGCSVNLMKPSQDRYLFIGEEDRGEDGWPLKDEDECDQYCRHCFYKKYPPDTDDEETPHVE